MTRRERWSVTSVDDEANPVEPTAAVLEDVLTDPRLRDEAFSKIIIAKKKA